MTYGIVGCDLENLARSEIQPDRIFAQVTQILSAERLPYGFGHEHQTRADGYRDFVLRIPVHDLDAVLIHLFERERLAVDNAQDTPAQFVVALQAADLLRMSLQIAAAASREIAAGNERQIPVPSVVIRRIQLPLEPCGPFPQGRHLFRIPIIH